MKTPGLASLTCPADLLRKLRHDLGRIERDPEDVYAAFDFFVTAEHMIDWVLPGKVNRDARAALRAENVVLQVASHIASGSKHFVVEAAHHTSVEHVDAVPSAFQRGVFQEDAFQTGGLIVTLEEAAARALGLAISVRRLAAELLSFWERETARRATGARGVE